MNDIEIMARTLFGEARARDVEDAEAIASVILNRVGYRNWPSTVTEVCLQPKQFSCWNHDDPNMQRILAADRKSNTWFDQCWQIAERAMSGGVIDRTRTSTHYHTRAVSPRWSRDKTPVYETQGHIFFNNIDTPAPTSAKEALDMERPLEKTRTAVGAAGAAVGTTMAMASDTVAELAQVLGVVGQSSDMVALLGQIITILSIIEIIYARWDDRKQGLR